MNRQALKKYGWQDAWETQISEGGYPARVIRQDHDLYRVAGAKGELNARITGKMMYEAASEADYPAVGDWVVIDRETDEGGEAAISRILKRRSVFVRKAAGSSQAVQVVAANVDTIFLCMALNQDYNLRRLERYLTIAWDSGATPVVVLTKADLCDDLPQKLAEVTLTSAGCSVVVCSALSHEGLEQVRQLVKPRQTIAFLGSSGVGKSTLINYLLGEEKLATAAIGQNDKGRHTTTHRQLYVLPDSGMVIDTPGMRELQLESGDLSRAFDDIEALAADCRFRDCTHSGEPGCAVQAAIADGLLDQSRLDNYHKLQRELGYEGLNSRQMEAEKIRSMFGSKQEMKQAMRAVKQKNHRR